MQEVTETALGDSLLAALRRLARHYIPARYPDAHPAEAPEAFYGPEDARSALDDVDLVLAAVDAQWSELSRKSEDLQ